MQTGSHRALHGLRGFHCNVHAGTIYWTRFTVCNKACCVHHNHQQQWEYKLRTVYVDDEDIDWECIFCPIPTIKWQRSTCTCVVFETDWNSAFLVWPPMWNHGNIKCQERSNNQQLQTHNTLVMKQIEGFGVADFTAVYLRILGNIHCNCGKIHGTAITRSRTLRHDTVFCLFQLTLLVPRPWC